MVQLAFWNRLGIGGRLFLAFAAIMALSLVSASVGWLELREVAGTQSTITRSAMPAATEARAVAEASARLIASAPLLTGAASEARREAEATALFAEADKLRETLVGLGRYGFESAALEALGDSVDRLLQNLSAQNDLVARRLALTAQDDARLADALGAAIGLFDLSETLVSNATAGTSALISNIYDLVEDPAQLEQTLLALDRLVESDVFFMERMYELRMRSSQLGLQLNQLNKTVQASEIDGLESTVQRNLQVLARRVDSIPDPVRRDQAIGFFERLRQANGEREAPSVFALRRDILGTVTEIERLSDENRQVSGELSALAVDLVEESRSFTGKATKDAETAVRVGLITLLGLSVLSLIVALSIIWLYVRGSVIKRLNELAGAMRSLAHGDLAVAVEAQGNDELTEMAQSVQFFKDEALRKRELEAERERTAIELRRHRDELEELVRERTAQLSEANERLREEVANHDRARERAEQASRSKSEFLATMSHEIRTPMNGMLGMLHVLANSDLSEQQESQLELVESSGEALLGILNDILDYSKIESGYLDLEETDFDLKRLVGGIVGLMDPQARAKGLTLEVDHGARVPTWLKGDPGKLRQILFNLISNGLKFTHEGQIKVSVSGEPTECDQTVILRFEVADTGIGLELDEHEKLFEAFYQKDSSISRVYGGTGLGLAISKRLVTALGGEIDFDSVPGQGTRFWFTLQYRRGVAGDTVVPAVDGRGAMGAPLAILVVEDNEVNRLVAKAYLEDMGHAVTLAMDAPAALAAVDAATFDAVLMDISLPGMSGMDATRRIRDLADPVKKRLPIIAMSAHVFASEIDDHLRAGMDAFIGKPMSPDRLQTVLSQVFANGRGGAGTDGAPISIPDTNGAAPAWIARQVLADDLAALGPARTERMVELFLEATPGRVRDLESAVLAADFEAASFAAHALRASATSLGLERLAAELLALEDAAKAKQAEALAARHADFGAVYEQSALLLTDTWDSLRE